MIEQKGIKVRKNLNTLSKTFWVIKHMHAEFRAIVTQQNT